jgi:hypothetical protein
MAFDFKYIHDANYLGLSHSCKASKELARENTANVRAPSHWMSTPETDSKGDASPLKIPKVTSHILSADMPHLQQPLTWS